MTATTVQNIIRIGTSRGNTLPTKLLQQLGVDVGDQVKITIEKVEAAEPDVLKEYAKFKAQYGQTLKNLSQR